MFFLHTPFFDVCNFVMSYAHKSEKMAVTEKMHFALKLHILHFTCFFTYLYFRLTLILGLGGSKFSKLFLTIHPKNSMINFLKKLFLYRRIFFGLLPPYVKKLHFNYGNILHTFYIVGFLRRMITHT